MPALWRAERGAIVMTQERTRSTNMGTLRNARVVVVEELATDIRSLELAPLDNDGRPALTSIWYCRTVSSASIRLSIPASRTAI